METLHNFAQFCTILHNSAQLHRHSTATFVVYIPCFFSSFVSFIESRDEKKTLERARGKFTLKARERKGESSRKGEARGERDEKTEKTQ